MDKTKSLYAIYKYDFHQATQRTVLAEAEGADGANNVNFAQKYFETLFDLNTIDKLAKKNRKAKQRYCQTTCWQSRAISSIGE